MITKIPREIILVHAPSEISSRLRSIVLGLFVGVWHRQVLDCLLAYEQRQFVLRGYMSTYRREHGERTKRCKFLVAAKVVARLVKLQGTNATSN